MKVVRDGAGICIENLECSSLITKTNYLLSERCNRSELLKLFA